MLLRVAWMPSGTRMAVKSWVYVPTMTSILNPTRHQTSQLEDLCVRDPIRERCLRRKWSKMWHKTTRKRKRSKSGGGSTLTTSPKRKSSERSRSLFRRSRSAKWLPVFSKTRPWQLNWSNYIQTPMSTKTYRRESLSSKNPKVRSSMEPMFCVTAQSVCSTTSMLWVSLKYPDSLRGHSTAMRWVTTCQSTRILPPNQDDHSLESQPITAMHLSAKRKIWIAIIQAAQWSPMASPRMRMDRASPKYRTTCKVWRNSWTSRASVSSNNL